MEQTIIGKVKKHIRGFGFLFPENSKIENNIYLTEESMRFVMQGDRVRARITSRANPLGPRAEVVQILERGQKNCIGRLRYQGQKPLCKRSEEDPDSDVWITGPIPAKCQENDLILIEIESYPDRNSLAKGTIVDVLDESSANLDVTRTCVTGGWPMEFSPETLSLADRFEIDSHLPSWRKDCRHLPFVTIDGEDAKDFDDAVACVQESHRKFRVYVAIADVSHYVQPQSPIDKDAYIRATSVYFPGAVNPMLPEQLSNELCSLVPNVDREVLVCEMLYDHEAKRQKFSFYPGRIKSRRRCTYAEVEHFKQSGTIDASDEVKASLKLLYTLYDQLIRQRKQRGTIDFDLPEYRVYVDSSGFPTQVVKQERYDAHKLIEEWMIAANICAAEFMNPKIGVFRNHESPKEQKMLNFLSLVRQFFPRNAPSLEDIRKSPQALQRFLSSIADNPKKELIHGLALRSMPQAVYGTENKGHYGLALKFYTHFTSPIRRYPDLIVHRLIKQKLGLQKASPTNNLSQATMHCSNQERSAMELERKVNDIKKARYMSAFLGEAFTGKVSSIIANGMFVRLDFSHVDGFIALDTLPRDQYQVNEQLQTITGNNRKHRFQIGDAVNVQCVAASIETGRINLELLL